MAVRRIDRINSLLKEVIAEVIYNDVRNPKVSRFVSVTRVETSKDLGHAKVYVSIIANEAEKIESLKALNSAAGFIAVQASDKVVLRHFPNLKFFIDDTVDKQLHIQKLLDNIEEERSHRGQANTSL